MSCLVAHPMHLLVFRGFWGDQTHRQLRVKYNHKESLSCWLGSVTSNKHGWRVLCVKARQTSFPTIQLVQCKKSQNPLASHAFPGLSQLQPYCDSIAWSWPSPDLSFAEAALKKSEGIPSGQLGLYNRIPDSCIESQNLLPCFSGVLGCIGPCLYLGRLRGYLAPRQILGSGWSAIVLFPSSHL